MNGRLRGLSITLASLVVISLSAGQSVASPGTESGGLGGHQPPAAGQTVDVTDRSGELVGTVHTMTREEIAAKGLTRFAGPAASTRADTGSAPTPVRSKTVGTSAQLAAGGCWTFSFKQPGWLGMDGYGSEDWCGSGGWVTYAAAGCWGTDGWYPTYNYLGCTRTTYYGAGWNVADTMYNFDFCIAWWGGGCAKHRHLWDRYRYGATGGVWLISYGG
jgi:hypothetical protein